MANNKNPRQYTSRPKFLHRFSQKQLVGMIVSFGVGILGVWTILFSSAATTGSVDFVLFCPPVGQTCAVSSASVRSYASSVQSWYAGKLGSGRTFKINSVTVKYAPRAVSYYGNGGSDANNRLVLNRIAADLGINLSPANSIKTQVVTGFQVFYNSSCRGYSYIPGSIGVEDGAKCNPKTMPQLIAHELGHSFGLQHVTTRYDVMHPNACFNGTYTVALPSCTMNSTARSQLLNNYSGWFLAPNTIPPPTTTPPPPTTTCTGNDRLTAGQSLYAGETLTASNCARLSFGSDGNLTVSNSTGTVIWQSSSANNGGTRAYFQSDGNFVIYTDSSTPIWNTATSGRGGSLLIMQTDGNLVLYSSTNIPLWSSKQGRLY